MSKSAPLSLAITWSPSRNWAHFVSPNIKTPSLLLFNGPFVIYHTTLETVNIRGNAGLNLTGRGLLFDGLASSYASKGISFLPKAMGTKEMSPACI